MNKLQKYKNIRSLSDKEFQLFETIYKLGNVGLLERIDKIVKIAIAGLLGYISFSSFQNNEIAMSVMTGISTTLMLFNENISAIIASLVSAIKVTKMKPEEREKIANNIMDMSFKIKREKINRKLNDLRKAEQDDRIS